MTRRPGEKKDPALVKVVRELDALLGLAPRGSAIGQWWG